MLDNLTTAVLLFDRELRLVAMNPAAEALLEVSENKVRGFDAARLFPETEEEVPSLYRSLGSGVPVTERDLQLRLNAARTVTVDYTVTPVDEDNPPAGPQPLVLLELSPLDHHKRITREEQASLQNQSARALVRGLAHEIRNPLGGLRGAAQLLAQELEDESLREYTEVIIGEADRLQGLLDRMLGPRTPPQVRRFNVHEVTDRALKLLESEAPAGVSILRDYDPSIPDLHADREMLIQATLNVARNAVQALEPGDRGNVTLRTRIHRQLTIGQQRHRLVVAIEVHDDGPGVPRGLSETMFYPMVTGRPEGTGLGLSIAQSLVGQLGGFIECRSAPGDTTFSILLPLEAVS